MNTGLGHRTQLVFLSSQNWVSILIFYNYQNRPHIFVFQMENCAWTTFHSTGLWLKVNNGSHHLHQMNNTCMGARDVRPHPRATATWSETTAVFWFYQWYKLLIIWCNQKSHIFIFNIKLFRTNLLTKLILSTSHNINKSIWPTCDTFYRFAWWLVITDSLFKVTLVYDLPETFIYKLPASLQACHLTFLHHSKILGR